MPQSPYVGTLVVVGVLLLLIPLVAQVADDDVVLQSRCPFIEGTGQIGGTVRAILAEDPYIYAIAGHRLLVLDASDPTKPEVVGRTPPQIQFGDSPAWALDLLAYHDGFVFVRGVYCSASGPPSVDTAVVAYDVTDPKVPVVAGRISRSDAALGCVNGYSIGVLDGTLFAAGCFVVRTIDISDASAMSRLNNLDPIMSAAFYDMAVVGRYLYVQDPGAIRGIPSQPGLRVFDIGDPSAVFEASVVPVSGFEWQAIAAAGEILIGYGDREGLHVIDASDALAPREVGHLEIDLRGYPNGHTRGTWADLETDGSHLYLTRPANGRAAVAVVDISDPVSPSLIADIRPLGEPWDIELSGTSMYVANGFEHKLYHKEYRGIEVYDISRPERPLRVGGTTNLWPAFDVAVDGALAFVAAGAAGLRVIDISDPHEPAELGYLDSIGQINDVVVEGQYAYLACGLGDNPGVAIVDVADPSAPMLAATIKLPEGQDTASSLVLVGDSVYEATEEGWLHVINVADPLRPTLTASKRLALSDPFGKTDAAALAVAFEGDHLYVVLDDPTAHGWLAVWSIADPNSLEEISRLELDHGQPFGAEQSVPFDVAVVASRAYVPIGANLLLSIDVSDPANPLVVGTTRMPVVGGNHRATCVTATGDRVYACMPQGYAVFGTSGPMPEVLASGLLFGGPWDARRHNGIAVTSDGHIVLAHYGDGLMVTLPDEPPTPTSTSNPTPTPTSTAPPGLSPQPSATRTVAPTVAAPASASPSPTNAPTPTDTPSPKPTPTALPTTTTTWTMPPVPSSTATPTPTPRPPTAPPHPLYLPLTLSESCPPKGLFVDVVLVVDASTSMRDPTSDRRRKIDVAVESARAFLDGLRLRAGQDRAGIVTFNEKAKTLQHLTSDRTHLDVALSRIRIVEQSRVDLGVERAMVELVTRGRPGHVQAMVVLSDGKANPVPGDQAVAASRRAQLEGITVYVVGMGPSLDERVLAQMASGAERYFPAPDPLLVRAIYQDLTRRVPCPPETYWGRR